MSQKKGKPPPAASAPEIEVRKDVPLAELEADGGNPRHWTGPQLAGLRNSIQAFGLVEPIVFNKRTNTVIGGHMRVCALRAAGLVAVPLVVVVDLSKTDARALGLALNNRALQGRFVTRKAKKILDELHKSRVDLYVQLGLGTILDQAAADELDGAGGKKKSVEFDETLRTVKIRVTLSQFNVWLRAFARAKEMAAADGVDVSQVDDEKAKDPVVFEKLCSDFLTTNGEAQSAPQREEKRKARKETATA